MLKENNVRFQVIGGRKVFPAGPGKHFKRLFMRQRDNTGLIVNLAFNYGSRQEIIDAVKKSRRRWKRSL